MDPLALNVAFLGFSPAATARIADWAMEGRPEDCGWLATRPALADIWCVDGRAVTQYGPDGFTIETGADGNTEPVTCLYKDAPALIAVACREPSTFPGAVTFDPDSKFSVAAAFRTLEARLAPLRCEYALGGAFAAQQDDLLMEGVYHLVHQGRLLAVADLRHRSVGFSLLAAPSELVRCDWHKRPACAGAMPESFIVRTPSELLWTFAVRTRDDILPPRFRRKPIHFRCLPRVPADRLSPVHVKAMALLQAGPMTLAQLVQRLGICEREVARSIAALCTVGVVTTQAPPQRAALAIASLRKSQSCTAARERPSVLSAALWRLREAAASMA